MSWIEIIAYLVLQQATAHAHRLMIGRPKFVIKSFKDIPHPFLATALEAFHLATFCYGFHELIKVIGL